MFKAKNEPFVGMNENKLDELPSIQPSVEPLAEPIRKGVMKAEAIATGKKKPTAEHHPPYYNQGSIECWDFITSHNMGFLQGNIVKYVTRYKQKHGKEDLLKAYQYLKKLVDVEYKEKI